MKYKAITIQSAEGKFWSIITKVGVSIGVDDMDVGKEIQATYWTKCLWDTGATHSMISKNTVETLGLKPIGDARLLSAHGEAITNIYKASLNLPDQLILPRVKVTECATNDSFGVVIGMDIITMGDFSITNFGGGYYIFLLCDEFGDD